MNLKTTCLSLLTACLSFVTMHGQIQPHDLDPAFSSPFGSDAASVIACMAVQPDNKIIAGGYLRIGNTTTYSSLVRLNEDGSFNQDLLPSTTINNVNALLLLPDGKIVIGGIFALDNGNPDYMLARLNSDGSVDTTFPPVLKSGMTDRIYTLALQSDGKIVAGGDFDTIGGLATANLARFNTNGTVDPTLNLTEGPNTTGFNDAVSSVVVLPGGKIVVSGGFTSFSAISARHLVRLNTDGSLDTTFNTGTGLDGSIASIYVKPDGKMLIGGSFTTYNGTTINNFGSLNADGTIDTTFNPGGAGAVNPVGAIEIDPQGRIYIGGIISQYNGEIRSGIARLNSDGTLDTLFNPHNPVAAYYNGFSGDFGGGASIIKIVQDGKVLAGGTFSKYKNTTINNIARLNGGEFLGTETLTKNTITYYPNPVSDKLYLQSADAVTSVQVVSLTGQVVQQAAAASGLDAIDMSGLQAGCYFVNAATASGTINVKVIKK